MLSSLIAVAIIASGTCLPFDSGDAQAIKINGKIYCIGGFDNPSEVHIYDGTWSKLTNMPGDKSDGFSVAYNGTDSIYVFGGNNSSTYKYFIADDNWTVKAPCPVQMDHFCTWNKGNKIYCLGGNRKIQIYNTSSDKWSEKNIVLQWKTPGYEKDGKFYNFSKGYIRELDPVTEEVVNYKKTKYFENCSQSNVFFYGNKYTVVGVRPDGLNVGITGYMDSDIQSTPFQTNFNSYAPMIQDGTEIVQIDYDMTRTEVLSE